MPLDNKYSFSRTSICLFKKIFFSNSMHSEINVNYLLNLWLYLSWHLIQGYLQSLSINLLKQCVGQTQLSGLVKRRCTGSPTVYLVHFFCITRSLFIPTPPRKSWHRCSPSEAKIVGGILDIPLSHFILLRCKVPRLHLCSGQHRCEEY